MRRRHDMRSAWILSLFLAHAVGCGEDTPAPPPRPASRVDVDEARAQVTAIFDAIEARDCAAIVGRLVHADDDEQCQEFLRDTADHGMRLIELIEAHPDGRAPDVVVVRAGVERDGRTHQVLVRVTHRDDRWTVAL